MDKSKNKWPTWVTDIKNRISHRGQALQKLKLKLNQIYG